MGRPNYRGPSRQQRNRKIHCGDMGLPRWSENRMKSISATQRVVAAVAQLHRFDFRWNDISSSLSSSSLYLDCGEYTRSCSSIPAQRHVVWRGGLGSFDPAFNVLLFLLQSFSRPLSRPFSEEFQFALAYQILATHPGTEEAPLTVECPLASRVLLLLSQRLKQHFEKGEEERESVLAEGYSHGAQLPCSAILHALGKTREDCEKQHRQILATSRKEPGREAPRNWGITEEASLKKMKDVQKMKWKNIGIAWAEVLLR
ncbi:hypothetical protein BU16DRAFT_536967 [Lophium mytilinum]|uniref:Uncharacterized protein n=1 Tax=Lophium mytilinum TaxID=390894 RepID=A0A6A6QXW2_9PEZI|nr:hypothetical protein BU16DRAFT_536967 [Lophium mytilinum]